MEDRIPPPVVEAARNGDAGALAAVCEMLYPRIFRYLSRVISTVCSRQAAMGASLLVIGNSMRLLWGS